LLDAAVHMPPAFSQSAIEVYCPKSPLVPDGLADGAVDGEVADGAEPTGAVLPPPDVPEPLPDAPEPLPLPDAPGLPAPEPPGEPLPLPPPLPDCAAATTGARAMIPTRNAPTYFRIVISSIVGVTDRFVLLVALFSNLRAADGVVPHVHAFHPHQVVLSTFRGSAAVTAGRVRQWAELAVIERE
jgi:hypothetical protein